MQLDLKLSNLFHLILHDLGSISVRQVIKCNVNLLVEPYEGECWVCGGNEVLIAHDVSVDQSLCIHCVNHAILVDDELEHLTQGQARYEAKQ